MKISLLIIAHNEESHIRECLDSLMNQREKADEVILIAHNCTDRTSTISREFSGIVTYELHTEEIGPIYARKYGFEKVTGDIIACIDGDSVADSDWLEKITAPFSDPSTVGVGGKVYFYNNWRGNILSFFFFLQGLPLLRHVFPFYFWGANFACRRSTYEKVGGMDTCIDIADKLDLHYPAEDMILSFLLLSIGKIIYRSKAINFVYPGKFFDGTNRGQKQNEDYQKIRKYFKTQN